MLWLKIGRFVTIVERTRVNKSEVVKRVIGFEETTDGSLS